MQLSGYRPGELLGDRVGFGRVSYYQRLPWTNNVLGNRVFAGVSTEFGKIRETFQQSADAKLRSSLGIFIGADTPIGPLYLGYGRARDRGTIFYFFLGQP